VVCVGDSLTHGVASCDYVAELARRLDAKAVSTYAVHPGVVGSDLWRRIPWPFRAVITRSLLTNEQGAETTLHCACAPEVADQTGLYHLLLAEFERPLITVTLEETRGNQVAAARLLGINRNTLRKKISELEITVPRRRGRPPRVERKESEPLRYREHSA